jgi:predicted ATP-grasp superfamily ATP-dependent carboligase
LCGEIEGKSVLITYAWCRSSYIALRSLNRLGLKVIVADTSSVGMAQWSRIRSGVGKYSPPLTNPEAFVEDIVALLECTGAHFLLPGHDETEILSRYRDRLPQDVILPVAQYEKIALANNKARMAGLACNLDVPVPKVLPWASFSELDDCLQYVDFPLIVKLRRGNSAKGVYYPENKQAVLPLAQSLVEQYGLSPDRYPIVQERVAGDGWGVSCLYWQGERLASFTHRRMREKTSTGGTSTLRVSQRNPQLEAMAHHLLDEMEWHGLAMVEFKYNSETQQGWFIEVNPRLWGSIHLAVVSGVDFPALLYRAATEGPESARSHIQAQREGIVARWYLGDAIKAAGELFKLRPLEALRLLMPDGADTYDDWHWDDPGAFLGQAVYYLATFLKTRSLNPEQEGMIG